MDEPNPNPKPARRVDVTRRTTTEERWGDSYRDEAQGHQTDDWIVRLEHELPRDTKGDARHALGRLLFAHRDDDGNGSLDGDGDHVWEVDADGMPQETTRRCSASATFHAFDQAGADELLARVQAYAAELRSGMHDPPTITVEQSRAFSEHGIALRDDGIFGYKRKCARDGCPKPGGSGDCFGALTAAEAIEGAQKRDVATCGLECWLDAGFHDGFSLEEDLEDKANDVNRRDVHDALWAAGCLRHDTEDDPPRWRLTDDWWAKAKLVGRAKQVVLAAAEDACDGADFDGSEDAIPCEL